MNLKIVVAISILVAAPAFAQAQTGGAAAKPPKVTKADVQKVVQTITADQSKLKLYCDLQKLIDQAAAADEKKDTKKVDELTVQIEETGEKIGPDYAKLAQGIEQNEYSDDEGKEINSVLEPLDKLCSAK